jgi:medium-chain acyl-[acyl-carrier-protein] hydrolase
MLRSGKPMNGNVNRWISCFEKRPAAKVRLLCFPHAGGSATAFATWHRELPKDIELCVVQLPGRDQRRDEPHRMDMKPLVAELLGLLAEAHDRRVALFGYSLGALIAFEYAREVRKMGAGEPEHLFVAARKGPTLPKGAPVSALPDAEFIREMTRKYEGIPKVILDDPELLAYFLPTIRADVTLLESHVYEKDAPLTCPLTALGGATDPSVDRAALEAWQKETTGRFEAKVMPGGHFFATQSRPEMLKLVAESLL